MGQVVVRPMPNILSLNQMRVKNESNSLYSLSLTYSFGASIEGKDERKSAQDLRSRM